MRTDLVGRLRLEARGAQALAGGLKSVVGAALVAARPRYFSFRISHRQSPVRESALAGATGEIRKGSPSRINLGFASAVINLVQIRSTARAQAGATRLTKDPHGHGEQDLLGREFLQIEILTLQERNVEIALIESGFCIERRGLGQVVLEREVLRHAPRHRFQAPRARQLAVSGAAAGDRKNVVVGAHLTRKANRDLAGHLIGTESFGFYEDLLIEAQWLVFEF
jgi:hypothetical protein